VHHILEVSVGYAAEVSNRSFHSLTCSAHTPQDVFGEEKTAKHSGTKMASTSYFRFNANVGRPDSGKFPIDEIDPGRLQELCDIVDAYMEEDEQKVKLKKLGDLIHPKNWIQRAIQCNIDKSL
jgi:hypothetical protein